MNCPPLSAKRRSAVQRLLLGLLVVHSLSPIVCDVRAESMVAGVQAIQSHLETHGIDGFREAITANGWQAPVIPSRWHMENRTQQSDLPLITAARGLGLLVVRRTDDWAPLMQGDEGATLMDKAVRLVDLAEWIGSAQGYGNLITASHACEVALTGLARFVADLAYPLPAAKVQVERCNLPITSGAARGQILNNEIGAEVFPTSQGTTSQDLNLLWRLRKGRIDLQNVDSEERQAQSVLFDALLAKLSEVGLDPNEPDSHADFFSRDGACRIVPNTTEACWDSSHHSAVTQGTRLSQPLTSLERLILFRETIEAFPTAPSLKGAFWGDRKQAFLEAWDQHASAENQNLGGAAEDILRSIEEGTFVDADTRERQRPSVQTAIAQTAAVETETPDAPQTPSPAETPGP